MADWIAATPVNGIDVGGFLQYGAVGIIAALGVSFFFFAFKGERERANRSEAKYDKVIDNVIPVLLETASSAKQNMDLLKEVQEKIVPLLAELERQNRGRQ